MKKQNRQLRKSPELPLATRALPSWAAPVALGLLVAVFYWIPLTSAAASIQWDAADMHLPLQRYFASHLISGTIPFWTPYLFSGYPFLANPEAAAWYLPHWPFYLAGVTPLAIQLELALHAFLACLGSYLLLRRLALHRSAAFAGALAYGLSGFFAGHSSHVGLFSAAAWFPWLLLAYRRAMDGRAARYAALGGIAGGAMILAGYFQTALYGFLALGLYSLADLRAAPRRWRRPAGIVTGMLAGALAVGAIQILPGLELTRNSFRAAQEFSKSTEGVLHVGPLLTLVAPDALGAVSGEYRGPSDVTQYYFYAGLLLLPLAALGAAKSKLRVPALLMTIPAAWYMLGPAGGLYHIGALIPGMHKVRAPVQGWFVVAFGLALLAAAGANWLFQRWNLPWLKIGLAAILFADLWYWNSMNNPLAYARHGFAELYGAREQVVREHVANSQPPLTRFEAPRYFGALGPLDHPLDLKLESTYGYFALEPALYDHYAEAMARNSRLRDGLNVSRVLNTQNGNLDANLSMLPRAYFPSAVRSVGSEPESKQALETLDPGKESTVLGPHVAFQQDAAATATVASHGEQWYRIRYRAATPSLLKLSVSWYPGWRAALGGQDLEVLRVDHALMGTVVPAGEGEVEFRFHSNYFAPGLGITLAGLLILGLLAWQV